MTALNGMSVAREGERYVTHRETREAVVEVGIDFGPIREPALSTGLAFFDHMLEMLGWYADVTLDARYDVKTYRLMHVICEDVGLAMGAASAQIIRDRIPEGVESNGSSPGMMDEASALAQISFEGRSGAYVTRQGAGALERVEDMLCVDLVAFFEGFSQGGRCTIHLDLHENSRDPHHAWECAFRAFARAWRAATTINPRRAGKTAGVKGTLD